MSENLDKILTGKRKSSIARVKLYKGEGKFTINKREAKFYLKRSSIYEYAIAPLRATENLDKFDLKANIRGGGLSGQSGALRLAIAKALVNANPDYRKILKKLGMMTRDARIVERKKAGLHKARKATQFSKR
jgi:small subunit ribosomal protein S9